MHIPIPWLFKRKTRWMRQVDAYVDGRLTPIERELLEEKLAESDDVRAMLEETRALKQGLGSMPEHQPRRSFAVTPGMLAEERPQPAPRTPAVTMRLAQATTFAAMAALAITATVHINDVGGGSDSDDSMAPMSGESAMEDSADADDAAPADDGADADSFGAADEESADGEVPEAAPQRAADDARSPSATNEPESRNFVPVYGALGAVLALAAGAWLFSRRRIQNE